MNSLEIFWAISWVVYGLCMMNLGYQIGKKERNQIK